MLTTAETAMLLERPERRIENKLSTLRSHIYTASVDDSAMRDWMHQLVDYLDGRSAEVSGEQ